MSDETVSRTLSRFHDSDFFLDIKNVTLGPIVGQGQFSEVHVGRYFGDLVAIKIQKRENAQLEEYLVRELSVLKNTGHENLLGYLGAFNELNESSDSASQGHKLYIITEYCHGGDLLSLLLNTQQQLSWKFRLKIALQAIAAISYLHEKKLLHRDVKSSNILLDSNWNCKVSDFGMSREYAGDSARMTICGTDAYMAPEMLFDEEYTSSVDIFSFGMVLLEILRRQKVGENGFAVREPRKLFKLEEEDLRAQLPSDAPPSFVALALECIKYVPQDRPTAPDAFEWLQDLYDSIESDGAALPVHRPLPIIGVGTINLASNEKERLSHLRKVTLDGDDLATDDVRKTGFLFKRATSGFRNWKKVIFVLTRQALCWKSNSTGITKGKLLLRGATLQRTIMYRFKIIPQPSASIEKDDDVSMILNGELSAGTKTELDEWMDELQQVIDDLETADQMIKARQRGHVPNALVGSAAGTGVFDTDAHSQPVMLASYDAVQDWLHALGLDEYAPNFVSKRYDVSSMLEMAGLDNDDLDCLGIFLPLHRRILKSSAGLPYTDSLQIEIPRWRDFNAVICYCIVSNYKFSRSSTLKRFTDFKTFDSLVRVELKDSVVASDHAAFAALPVLPSSVAPSINLAGQKDVAFLAARRSGLEEYLHQLQSVLRPTSHYYLLLKFLDLTLLATNLDGAYS